MSYISPISSYVNRNYPLNSQQVVHSNNLPQIAHRTQNIPSKIKNIAISSKASKYSLGFAIPIGISMSLLYIIKINKKRILNSIPKDLQTKFEKIKDLKGKAFVNKAYEELVNYMKLDGIAPPKIEFKDTERAFQIEGGYIPAHNKIEFSDNFLHKLNKAEQIELIAHELRHCKQFTDMLRTEGISKEKFAQAITELNINSIKRSNFSFKHNYHKAKAQGNSVEFLNNVRKDTYSEILPLIEKNFAHILQLPKYKKNSLESREALKNIETIYAYNGIDSLGLTLQNYKNQLIETDAYQFGARMKDLFKKYKKATS